MARRSKQKHLLQAAGAAKDTQEFLTLGTVVDTNDPMQMGRVRTVCLAWGDTFSTNVEDLPWCTYVSPFGGQVQVGSRGPGLSPIEGGTSYGIWAIPKVKAQVIVACLDGDPQIRVYMGCVYDMFVPHTMPSGRFMYDDHPALEKDGMDAKPAGPYSSRETFIEPLNTNIKQAFGRKGEPNYEWRNRAADYVVARIEPEGLDFVAGQVPDDKDVVHDGWTSTQGYAVNRQDPLRKTTLTDKNYDSQILAITSPGFHTLTMDDRMENCRIRLRTTAGHQILMDDTNERMYIQTAQGNNWIELDQSGNIDIYSANKVNIHAAKDINLTSDESIRMHAKKGIHMYSEEEIRIQALKDVNVRTNQNIRVHATQSTYWQADQNIHYQAGASFYLSAAQEINQICDSDMKLSTKSTMHRNAELDIFDTSGPERRIDHNGAPATIATDAQLASEQPALWTNRVPRHEPWPRVMTKNDFTHEDEFPYTSDQVNRSERGTTITRGLFWRR
jgi:hypothetical protein